MYYFYGRKEGREGRRKGRKQSVRRLPVRDYYKGYNFYPDIKK